MFVIDDRVESNARLDTPRDVFAREDSSGRGRRLASLDTCDLRDRFYSWRGAQGRRCVCSVFGVDAEAIVADFSRAVIIGVARAGAARHPICVLSSRDFRTPVGCAVRDDARALGVNEWHVHFGVEDDHALRGLAIALLN